MRYIELWNPNKYASVNRNMEFFVCNVGAMVKLINVQEIIKYWSHRLDSINLTLSCSYRSVNTSNHKINGRLLHGSLPMKYIYCKIWKPNNQVSSSLSLCMNLFNPKKPFNNILSEISEFPKKLEL